ncbi:MAG: DUF3786 domain-containing protein [Deltaproteobacteria bacterium]|nr:DUF3786 domain-containing protein [Deltaproteobacteria bacterium]
MAAEPLTLEDNRLFRWADQMPAALWDDLDRRDPAEAARAAGGEWLPAAAPGGAVSLSMLNREYLIMPQARQVRLAARPDYRVSYQSALVLVSTLARAVEAPPSGRMVTARELPGGDLFFQGPHAIPIRPLEKRFGARPAELLERAAALGGEPWEGGDAAVKLHGLPRLPLYVLVWGDDGEFAARAVVGFDSRAPFHLALDGIWALANLMVHRLSGE